jgi:hypothetical protein
LVFGNISKETSSMAGKSGKLVRISIFILFLLVGAFFVIPAGMVSADQEGDYTYTTSGTPTVATVTGYTGPGGAIVIPSTLGGYATVAVGDYAFYYTTSLTSVTIPNTVTTIGSYAFSDCTSLTSVTIPNSVTSIADYAFNHCSLLSSIALPINIASIGEAAFSWCISLTSVTIPSSVTSIGDMAFSACTSLNSIEVNTGNMNFASTDGVLYDKTFSTLIQCPSGKTEAFIVPNGINSIGDHAFYLCNSLTSVTMPLSVVYIGNGTFYGCTHIIDMLIGSNVTSIGTEAFNSCTSLASITIPGKVSSIGQGAFYLCESLTSITFLGLTAPTSVGTNWIVNTHEGIRGHAYPASNFPAPGEVWNELTMGDYASTVPGSPTGLVATDGVGYVLLSWSAPSDSGNPAFTKYNIYRGTSSGSYGTSMSNVSAGIMTYNDTTVMPGTPYFYVVKAFNSVGSSPPSNEVTGTATSGPQAPSAPQNLVATSGNNSVVLHWSAPANAGNPAFTNYNIYRGATAGSIGTSPIGSVAVGTLTYNDSTAINGNTYVYAVKAVNSVGPSSASNTAQGSPTSTPNDGGTSNNDMLYAGIGIVVALVIIIGASLYLKSKRSKTPPKSQ